MSKSPAKPHIRQSAIFGEDLTKQYTRAQLNEGFSAFLLTHGGKEDYSKFKDKILSLDQISTAKGAAILHYYSDPYNEPAKIVRFHIQISHVKGEGPVMWLSRNQYKTCRSGHKYFNLQRMKKDGDSWIAVWRYITFRYSPGAGTLQADAFNTSSDYDFWSFTDAGQKNSRTVRIHPARGNQET